MNDVTSSWATIILAAGQGKRMRSSLPKVLHPLAGWPMVRHVFEAARGAELHSCVVIAGQAKDAVREAIGDEALYVLQDPPLGTGHAVAQTREAVPSAEHVLVLNGDVPLIRSETLVKLMKTHQEQDADMTFLTAQVADAEEYGVVQRDASDRVVALVEAAERAGATEGPAEINSGQYCFRASWLWPHLASLPRSASGEYYLTSLVATAVSEGAAVIAVQAEEADEVRGVNDRVQLAIVEAALRQRINRAHMLAGVTIVDSASAYIDRSVTIGQDTVVEPNTRLLGATAIGRECSLGPNSTLHAATLGDRCTVINSTIEESVLEDDVGVGPYSHIRPGTVLGAATHIGNYAEIKNAHFGRGVKMGHHSYVGDADIGDETNIGAGTITCNFDGERKRRTVIGKRVFVGSDTKLVAPVTIGDDARTGAGSVVTKDIPPGALAVGAPARIMRGNES
jgi:bifunctional UDP-N-acetylglucosamine pyrophosphorylase/glucosamine-1-phosphate N-acetyltransferase